MKRIRLTALLFSAVAASALGLVSCGDSGPEPLRVGMDLTYPPFEFKDSNGDPDGVSVRLAEALAAELGRPLVVESMPFEGLIPGLSTGKIDLVISSMTATAERRKSIDFSTPYVTTELAILAGKDSGITGIDDLKIGAPKIAVRRGTTGETYAQEHLPNAELTSLTLDAACALEVSQGKAVAWIYDQLSIWQHHKSHPETTKALLDSFQREQWAIGIRKGNDALRTQIDTFLTRFKAEKKFEPLADRYLSKEKELNAEMGTPFLFE
ncbi:MAG: polar amino acid transport system substrate-binding protein [Verrucomicrobiales bacterium]|jgi:polar amino acid transport system substrate-binding protein